MSDQPRGRKKNYTLSQEMKQAILEYFEGRGMIGDMTIGQVVLESFQMQELLINRLKPGEKLKGCVIQGVCAVNTIVNGHTLESLLESVRMAYLTIYPFVRDHEGPTKHDEEFEREMAKENVQVLVSEGSPIMEIIQRIMSGLAEGECPIHGKDCPKHRKEEQKSKDVN